MALLQTFVHKGRELRLDTHENAGSAGAAGGVSEGAQRQGVRAPGAGHFEFSGLRAEWQRETLALTGWVSSNNLAYLYTEVLLKDPEQERYYGPVMRDYVRAGRNEGSSGITRPVWDETVDVMVLLRPLLRLVTDGAHHAFCFAFPEGYSSPGYRQGGLYTLAGESHPMRALLGFSGDGSLKRAIAYAEQDRGAGAKVLTPKQDDRFTPFAQVFTPSTAESGWDIEAAVTDTLTLGSYPLRVVTERALPGEYLVGLLAQDLDGGLFREYVPVTLAG
jgi:hypothetical protein